MDRKLHIFENGVCVYRDHLLPQQLDRYRETNLHEPEEEQVFLEIVRGLKQGARFVCIGAAIGYYALLAKLARKDLVVSCYEPLRYHRKCMKQNFLMNGFSVTDFNIFSEGLSATGGFKRFRVFDYSSAIDTHEESVSVIRYISSIFTNDVVKTITLEQVVERAGGYIDLLQMDIQGLERDILKTSVEFLTGNPIGTLIIGTHAKEIHEGCRGALERAGYTISFDLYETRLQPDGILVAESTQDQA